MSFDSGAGFDPKGWLAQTTAELRDTYARKRRVMSFAEYLALFAGDAHRQLRSAAEYVKDVFDHFGTRTVRTPRGTVPRWNLFDCAWDGGREALVGQEDVQGAVYRLIANFVREGRTSRLILLHGPNGSAKSTLTACIMRAMEHYSTLEEGALYRFNWVFPSEKLTRSGIGFGSAGGGGDGGDSYAYLEDEHVEAKIIDELRDHPLLLLPRGRRRELLALRLGDKALVSGRSLDTLVRGDLSHRNRQIFEALLASYHGDLAKVLRHVQVERFFISRRYRQGAATVEPQLSVDARARQLTSDRSLASLPPALQSLTLFEYHGELVDGHRGLIEYSDLLKRPLEAYKYLLETVEHGRVSLDVATLDVDAVFLGSSNEGYLAAFKEVPEFQSFKGRMVLVRVPYLLDYRQEAAVYAGAIEAASRVATLDGAAPTPVREGGQGSEVVRHVAPHVAETAALWAVLTRMRKPQPEKYPKSLGELAGRLSPLDKALLYGDGVAPEGFSADQVRELLGGLERIARESDSYPNYEGRTGASPREMKLSMMNAAQNPKYGCVSPFAVVEELEDLVKAVTVHEFLKQEPLPGGYHENRKFVFQVRDRLLDRIDDDARRSMGLVAEDRYLEQWKRYATHASHWVKKERVQNPVTGRDEEPDEDLMGEVERTLEVQGRKDDFRREVIARIGAWSIDHPSQKPDYETIFPRPLAALRDAFFGERKKQVRRILDDALVLLTDGPGSMQADAAAGARATVDAMKSRFGYCDRCARDALAALVKKRYP